MVLLLAQPHIKLDIADGSGCTALMGAADQGSLEIVDLLLKAGANPNLKDAWGETSNQTQPLLSRSLTYAGRQCICVCFKTPLLEGLGQLEFKL